MTRLIRHVMASTRSSATIGSRLPTHFRRWVSDGAAPSFRKAAQLRTVKLQLPDADEVLLRMIYATVNAGHDSFQACREGSFADWKGIQNLGADGLGEVVAVGANVDSLQEGDYVSCGGCRSFSEYTLPKESACVEIPSPDPAYTALRVAGSYAFGFMEHTEPVRAGDTLLVTAACGGVGHIAAQIGKLHGCHVIGTCGSAAKKEKLVELGLDRVVDYTEESLVEVLESEYPNGLDYVVEGVGGSLWKTAFEHLAPNGRILTIGFFSQYPHTAGYESGKTKGLVDGAPPLWEVLHKRKNVTVRGKRIIGQTWPSDRDVIARCRQRSFQLYEEGKLKVVLDATALERFRGIETVVDAEEYMLAGKNVGKMLVSF